MLSDTELLDRLDTLLRSQENVFEFWFDEEAGIMFAGEEGGDTLRDAIQKLVETGGTI